MKKRLSVLLLILVACLPGIVQATTVLVVGDSLSAGYGMRADQGWVHLLRQRLEAKDPRGRAVNASITGDTTHGGLGRLPGALQREKPRIVVLELGANDGLRGLDLARAKRNLADMIDLARAQDARVLLLGVYLPANYGKAYGAAFHAIYTELAAEKGVALVPFFLEGVAETRELMQADGIHPSAAAQPRILDNVWTALESLLDTGMEGPEGG